MLFCASVASGEEESGGVDTDPPAPTRKHPSSDAAEGV